MSKKVTLKKNQEFIFQPPSKGAEPKYPWDQWFDGSLWLLERSSEAIKGDYEAETNVMPAKIKSGARRKYKYVQVSRLDADGKKLVDAIIIRARDMTAEEREFEDALRAEEKIELAARKQAKKAETETTLPLSHTA